MLANAGVASRRAAEELIFSGKVKVNGKLVKLPQTPVHESQDKITVDGKQVLTRQSAQRFYFALNKPKGYICSTTAEEREDGSAPRLLLSLFDSWLAKTWRPQHANLNLQPPRLFTVGRLDAQSVGLIFVTNDGAWAQKVQHPSSGLTKEYVVLTEPAPSQRHLQKIAAGCTVDGVFVQPVAAVLDDSDRTKVNRVRVVVAEGRKHEVRELVGNAGLQVKALRRLRVGGFKLPRELAFGQFSELKPKEIRRVLDKGAQASLTLVT